MKTRLLTFLVVLVLVMQFFVSIRLYMEILKTAGGVTEDLKKISVLIVEKKKNCTFIIWTETMRIII